MIIQWFGHSYFRIDSKNKIIAIDPYSKLTTGLKPPRFKCDILLITQQQENHNNKNLASREPCYSPSAHNKSAIMGDPLTLEGSGEIETKGIFIEGITQKSNTIYLIKSEGVTLCHLGNLEKKNLKEELLEKVANVDILLVPIGGHDTINYEEAISLINQIEPKIIIPMHYALPNLKIKLDSLDKFLKAISKKPEVLDKLTIRKNNLPGETKLIVLNKQ
jgi:L-ascorbate metabolism protein UlaG (beta-lactamase superfamily)